MFARLYPSLKRNAGDRPAVPRRLDCGVLELGQCCVIATSCRAEAAHCPWLIGALRTPAPGTKSFAKKIYDRPGSFSLLKRHIFKASN
jgi:hypothetical protein